MVKIKWCTILNGMFLTLFYCLCKTDLCIFLYRSIISKIKLSSKLLSVSEIQYILYWPAKKTAKFSHELKKHVRGEKNTREIRTKYERDEQGRARNTVARVPKADIRER